MKPPVSDIAFTPAVKTLQVQHGSRDAYANMEQHGGLQDRVTEDLAAFILERNSLYLATANADGQPYIQHRGGPKGFLKVLNEHTLGLADFAGNKQYITAGNLQDNARAFLFLMDYANRRRIKIWARAEVVEGDPALIDKLSDPEYGAQAERAILFHVDAWDANCPRHIPVLFSEDDVEKTTADLRRRVATLEAENEQRLTRRSRQ